MSTKIPYSLRIWFIIHSIIDILFGLPLLFYPTLTLALFGFSSEETLMARLVGAALLGIGGVSWISKDKGKESYTSLLTLKIIWSLSAIFAIILSIAKGAPKTSWFFLFLFLGFSIVWVYYQTKMR